MELTIKAETESEIVASETLDTSGLLCPLPVYKASVALKKLSPGEVLELICTDPGSLADIPALANQSGHKLLRTLEGEGKQTFWLRKAAAPERTP
ncbi:MAG: sulfurtransferase TusA family protein [bacterium]|nr:sulfurtransferase TusA family protein [bacterium]